MTHDRTKEYAWGNGKEKRGNEHLNFLKSKGLKPYMKFLDIGCGWFRTGIPVIGYIGKENYYAIDKVDCSGMATKKLGIDTFKQTDDFELFDMTFDFIFAWSVFTHLEDHQIDLCLKNVSKAMHSKSKFFATYFEGKRGVHGKKKRCYRYPTSFFKKKAKEYGLICSEVGGEIPSPNQQMLLFEMEKNNDS